MMIWDPGVSRMELQIQLDTVMLGHQAVMSLILRKVTLEWSIAEVNRVQCQINPAPPGNTE